MKLDLVPMVEGIRRGCKSASAAIARFLGHFDRRLTVQIVTDSRGLTRPVVHRLGGWA